MDYAPNPDMPGYWPDGDFASDRYLEFEFQNPNINTDDISNAALKIVYSHNDLDENRPYGAKLEINGPWQTRAETPVIGPAGTTDDQTYIIPLPSTHLTKQKLNSLKARFFMYGESTDEGGTLAASFDQVVLLVNYAPPTSIFDPFTTPTNITTPTISGIATSSGETTIKNVEYRVDGGDWLFANPTDGAFDSDSDAFDFTTPPLAEGEHQIDARAVDSSGTYQTEMISLSLVSDFTAPGAPGNPSTEPSPTNSTHQIWTWSPAFDAGDGGGLGGEIGDGLGGETLGYWRSIWDILDDSEYEPWNFIGNTLETETNLGDGLWRLSVKSEDNAGNQSASSSGELTVDTISPEVNSLETQDNDHNGKIDAIKITLSENIDDSRLLEGWSDGWSVSGYGEPSIGTGEVINDNVLVLSFPEGLGFDTAVTPIITYSPSGDISSTHDLSGNELAYFEGIATDKAIPVLVSAITRDINTNGRIDRIIATLSEDINGSSSTPADYTIDGYSITGESESNGVITLTLSEHETANDTGAMPIVSLISGEGVGVKDLANNWSYGENSVTASDGAAPVSTLTSPNADTFHRTAINIAGSSADSGIESDTVDTVRLSYRVSGTDNEYTEITTITNEAGSDPFAFEYSWTPGSDGIYDIKAAATDDADNVEGSAVVIGVVYDTFNPTVTYTEDTPEDGLVTNNSRQTFSVSVSERADTCTLNFTGNYSERQIENGLSDGSGFTGLVYADDSAVNYALPFSFPFFGNSYNQLSVSTNALMNFASTYDPEYPGSPDRLRTGKTGIATAWTDLVTQLSARAAADNVRFRWNGYGWGTGGYITNEAVLRSNGTVELHYGNVNVHRNLTIGLSAGNGTDYVFSSLNGSSVISPISYAYSPGNGGSYSMDAVEGEGNKFTTTVDPMPEGDTRYSVTCTDRAENNGESDQRSLTVDTTAPTAGISYESNGITSTATMTPSEPVTITNNGGSNQYVFNANGTFTFEFVDVAGNTGSATATVDDLDDIDPESTIISPANNGTNSVIYQNTWNGTIEGTASDDMSGLDHVELSIKRSSDSKYWNGEDWAEGGEGEPRVTASGTDNWSYTLQQPGEDTYEIVSHAVDNSGNVEDSYKLTLVFDQTIPEVSIALNPADPDSGNGWYKTDPEATLTATDDKLTDYIEYQWNSTVGAWTVYVNPLKTPGEGNHILYYRAFDKAGNVSDTGIKSVKYDKTDLENGPLNVSVSPNPTRGTTATVKWEGAKDNVGIEKYEVNWSLDGTDISHTDSVGNQDREHDINKLDREGKWNVKVTAFDSAGNRKSGSTELTVDRTAPNAPVLTLTGTGVGEASLSWTKVSDARDYIVWYGNISGNYLYGARVGDVDNFTVRGLGGADYFFIVKGEDGAGNLSSNSNEVSTLGLTGAPGVEPGTPAEGFSAEVKGASTENSPTPTESVLGENQTNDRGFPWWLIMSLVGVGGISIWAFWRRP